MATSSQVDLGGLTFAVGLREDNPEEMVAKILPLTRIIPGEIKPRTIKKVSKKVVEDKPCERPDCMARKERYIELNSENEQLRQQLKALEGRVSASKNKISLTERSIQIAEDKNDNLKGQIDDVQARIFTVEADVEKGMICIHIGSILYLLLCVCYYVQVYYDDSIYFFLFLL